MRNASKKFLRGDINIPGALESRSYNKAFRLEHPEYFDPEGLLVFTGPQGSGKTLSAVRYCRHVLDEYPQCLFCSNVVIKGYEDRTIPYNGMESLSGLENGFAGVLYLIDEIHLEFNSLESKNISVEEMTEFAQQRKQRKHIVGTSQVFFRMAKPLREQVKNVVLCRQAVPYVQCNTLIDGTTAYEDNGELVATVEGQFYWFHNPDLYSCYDTYAKMHRYRKEWNSRETSSRPAIYSGDGSLKYRHGRRV